MNPLSTILSVLCAALTAACWFLWQGWDGAAAARDRAEAALKVEANNAQIVTKYIDRVVKVPGPAVIRDRFIRGMCIIPPVPDSAGADGTAGADAADRLSVSAGRFADHLSAELASVQRNRLKAEALQEALRPQVGQ